jgi:hypothetical protein
MAYMVGTAGGTPPPIFSDVALSGAYIVPPFIALSNAALVADTLYVVPIYIARGGTVTRIGINLAGSSAGNARLGIYSNTNARPGTRILDAGTVDTGSTGDKEVTISQALLSNTWYWLAYVASSTPNVRTVQQAGICGYGVITGALSASMNITRAFTYAALPADESAQTYTLGNGVNPPMIWVRIA